MMIHLTTILLLAAGSPLSAQDATPSVPEDHPVHLDRTGIEWVLPFSAAQKQAEISGRPLLLKAVAFGTTKEGCW